MNEYRRAAGRPRCYQDSCSLISFQQQQQFPSGPETSLAPTASAELLHLSRNLYLAFLCKEHSFWWDAQMHKSLASYVEGKTVLWLFFFFTKKKKEDKAQLSLHKISLYKVSSQELALKGSPETESVILRYCKLFLHIIPLIKGHPNPSQKWVTFLPSLDF